MCRHLPKYNLDCLHSIPGLENAPFVSEKAWASDSTMLVTTINTPHLEFAKRQRWVIIFLEGLEYGEFRKTPEAAQLKPWFPLIRHLHESISMMAMAEPTVAPQLPPFMWAGPCTSMGAERAGFRESLCIRYRLWRHAQAEFYNVLTEMPNYTKSKPEKLALIVEEQKIIFRAIDHNMMVMEGLNLDAARMEKLYAKLLRTSDRSFPRIIMASKR